MKERDPMPLASISSPLDFLSIKENIGQKLWESYGEFSFSFFDAFLFSPFFNLASRRSLFTPFAMLGRATSPT
jgi:hypothetical protein